MRWTEHSFLGSAASTPPLSALDRTASNAMVLACFSGILNTCITLPTGEGESLCGPSDLHSTVAYFSMRISQEFRSMQPTAETIISEHDFFIS